MGLHFFVRPTKTYFFGSRLLLKFNILSKRQRDYLCFNPPLTDTMEFCNLARPRERVANWMKCAYSLHKRLKH